MCGNFFAPEEQNVCNLQSRDSLAPYGAKRLFDAQTHGAPLELEVIVSLEL